MASPGPFSNICEVCKRMTSTLSGLRDLTSDAGYRHLKFTEVKRSARNGCKLCGILHQCHRQDVTKKLTKYHDGVYLRLFSHLISFVAHYKDARERQEAAAEKGLHPFESEHLTRLVSVPWDDALYGDSWKSPRLHPSAGLPPLEPIESLACYTSSGDPAATHLPVMDTKLEFRGQRITDAILRQLDTCNSNHSLCPKQARPMLPSRVLDVGPEQDPNTVRLRSSKSAVAQYLTLSYVWGGPPALTTTQASLSSRELGIAVGDLPATIRDAVQVTRDLGFRYLWVDVLCIVQDDADEKNREIAQMGEIYRNAALTISAANTSSVLGSFSAEKEMRNSCELPYLLPNGLFGTIYIRIRSQYSEKSPILTRAWTLQESTLSPRTLWYCDFDIRWTCAEDEDNAVVVSGPEGGGFTLQWHQLHYPLLLTNREQLSENEWVLERASYWAKMISGYTLRSLTYASDRLPALAGIASKLEAAWRSEYVNGLWKHCMVNNLSWYRFHESSKRTRLGHTDQAEFLRCHLPDAYDSPTWTWAAHAGPIRFGSNLDDDEDTRYLHPQAKLIRCNVDVEDLDTRLTRLWKGTLVLDANIFDEHQRLASQKVTGALYHFWWDHCDCNCKIFPYDRFHYLMLGSDSKNSFGLILAWLKGTTYRRVGCFEIFIETWPLGDRWPVSARRRVSII